MTRDKETLKLVIDTTQELVSELLYYGRKEDEELPLDRLDDAIDRGIVTAEQIIEAFAKELKRRMKET